MLRMFGWLALLARSDCGKDAEILLLCYQVAGHQLQVGIAAELNPDPPIHSGRSFPASILHEELSGRAARGNRTPRASMKITC